MISHRTEKNPLKLFLFCEYSTTKGFFLGNMQSSALRPVRRITPTTLARSPDTLDALPGGWDFDGCAEEIRKRTDPRAPSMLHVSDHDFALAMKRCKQPRKEGTGTVCRTAKKRKRVKSGYEMSDICEDFAEYVRVTMCTIKYPGAPIEELPTCKNCRASCERDGILIKKGRGRPKGATKRQGPLVCHRCGAEHPPAKAATARKKGAED